MNKGRFIAGKTGGILVACVGPIVLDIAIGGKNSDLLTPA